MIQTAKLLVAASAVVFQGIMTTIQKMPAKACWDHIAGRCLYQERLNPGYCREWRCKVLQNWEKVFEDFLQRAESFGLAQEQVNDLWVRRFERLMRGTFDCPEYDHAPGQEPPACNCQHDELCLLALPRCEGRCRHYEVREATNATSCHEDQE